MSIPSLGRRRHRRPALLAALAAVTVLGPLAAAATADEPVFEMPARFTQISLTGGSLVPDGAPAFAAVRGYPGAGATAGHSALQLYCTPYGPGTAIVGFQLLVGRWHTSLADGAVLNLDTDGGTWQSIQDGTLPFGHAVTAGPWNGPGRAMAPSRCIGARAVMRRTATGTTLAWTTDLQRVAVLDQTGPSVAHPAVDQAWVTGDAAPVRWDQGDNGFDRGGTWAEISGGGRVSLGDAPDGTVTASVPLGTLADGMHVLRVAREAPGWTTAVAETQVAVDRTPPPVPGVSASTEAWTNDAVVWIDSTASADAGSGWNRNEFRVDGGPWSARGMRWGLTQIGRHTVEARAVDNAGLASGPSALRTIRIDRTAPAIRELQIDTAAAGGPRLTFQLADQGGSGLGACPVDIAVARAGGAWSTVADGAGEAFAPRADLRLAMRTMEPGDYQLRVSACDLAGNRASQTARFTWTVAAARSANTTSVGTAGAAETGGLRVTGMRVQGLVAGGTLRLQGRLTAPGGAAAPAGPLTVIDPLGREVGTGTVVSGGRFRARARTTRSGVWRLRPAGRVDTATFRLLVSPRVTVRSATRARRTHLGVVVAPATAGRTVVVQVRGTAGWVPLRGARTGARGTARFELPAGLGRMRVVVRPGSGPAGGPAVVAIP